MELVFLTLLFVVMITAIGSGYPVAFALPGAAIISIGAAAFCGWVFVGNTDAFFTQGGPAQWLSAGVTNLKGVYWEVERDTLIAIPLFIFMGIMLQRSKIAEDLLITMAQLFGPIPGGLGVSVVFVGALLAATTGIVGATVVAMGLIALPAMLQNNYSQPLATGTIAASGTLGQIIPPSIVLIILADQLASATDQASTIRKALHKSATGEISMPSQFDVTSTSAGEMFLGALIPGLILVGLYMLYILVYALFRPEAAPPVRSEGKLNGEFFFRLGLVLVPPLALIFLVLGSIITGVATVNQAGAIGASGALIMAGYRLTQGQKGSFAPAFIVLGSIFVIGIVVGNFNTNIRVINTPTDLMAVLIAAVAVVTLLFGLAWSGWRCFKIENTLSEVMIETAKATSLVFTILLGAAMLTAAFRAFGGEELIKHLLESIPGGFWVKFSVVMVVIFILGFFLDFIEIAVVVVPIVAPILLSDPSANITAVWLGVMIGLNIQTSFLTPPFGFALFYLRGIAPAVVKTVQIYKGVFPFILLQISALFIVAYFPPLVNYLPNRMLFLSETAPPPRNPRIQYCVEEFIGTRFLEDSTQLQMAVSTAQGLQLDILPKIIREDFENSLASVANVGLLIKDAKQAEAEVIAASGDFRSIHTFVRSLERDARVYDPQIEELEIAASWLTAGDQKDARIVIELRIAEMKAKKAALLAQIPEDWAPRQTAFAALLEKETSLRNDFRRSADNTYKTVVELSAILTDSDKFLALKDEVIKLREVVKNNDLEVALDTVKRLEGSMGAIAGADKIKEALRKIRRELKHSKPKIAKIEKNLTSIENIYAKQEEWRIAAQGNLVYEVVAYELLLRETVGMRQQARMTREQALFLASCQSGHRDISLNF